jgi:hypothetical protein
MKFPNQVSVEVSHVGFVASEPSMAAVIGSVVAIGSTEVDISVGDKVLGDFQPTSLTLPSRFKSLPLRLLGGPRSHRRLVRPQCPRTFTQPPHTQAKLNADDNSLHIAASVLPILTAFASLHYGAHVVAGETILIPNGSSVSTPPHLQPHSPTPTPRFNSPHPSAAASSQPPPATLL